jgi:SNF2 family DNA or RNA helicase
MVFVGNITASSVGLNLQSARYVVFSSFSWVQAENLQSEDRVFRLTQDRDCRIVYEVFNDSVALDMLEKVLLKGRISDEIIKSENEKK